MSKQSLNIKFHPITWLTMGYMVWMLFPPLFSEKGYHYETLYFDVFALIFIVLGIVVGIGSKNLLMKKFHLTVDDKNLKYLVASCVLIVYGVKLSIYWDVGVYAFLHPYSRESSLIDTLSTVVQVFYVLLLTTLVYCTKKIAYILLFAVEILFNFIPQMSRSIYLYVIIYFIMAELYYGGKGMQSIAKRYFLWIMTALILIGVFGPFLNSVRSYAAIGEYEKGLAWKFTTEQIDPNFLIKRINIHNEAHHFSEIIDHVVQMDKLSFVSMFEKWTGIADEYRVHPTSISTTAGVMLGYGPKTATDFPRNLILGNYDWWFFSLFIFNVLLGLFVGFLYKVIFVKESKIFLMLWVPLVMGPMFASGGAVPSTFVFQLIFTLFSYLIIFIVYKFLKFLAMIFISILKNINNIKLILHYHDKMM